MKIIEENLNFKIIKLKQKNKVKLHKFDKNKYSKSKFAVILSQKTNSIEGNTTNLLDAQLIIKQKKAKGKYTISEEKEIKNIFNLYLNI